MVKWSVGQVRVPGLEFFVGVRLHKNTVDVVAPDDNEEHPPYNRGLSRVMLIEQYVYLLLNFYREKLMEYENGLPAVRRCCCRGNMWNF